MVTSLSLAKKRFDVHLAIFTPIKFYWQVISTSHNELLCRWWWRFSFIDVNYFPWQQSAKPHRVKQTTINRMGNLTFPSYREPLTFNFQNLLQANLFFFHPPNKNNDNKIGSVKIYNACGTRYYVGSKRKRKRKLRRKQRKPDLNFASITSGQEFCPISKPILHD